MKYKKLLGSLVTCGSYGFTWNESFLRGYDMKNRGKFAFFPIFKVIKKIEKKKYLIKQICKLTWGNGWYEGGKKLKKIDYKSYFVDETDGDFETEQLENNLLLISQQMAEILKHNKIKI